MSKKALTFFIAFPNESSDIIGAAFLELRTPARIAALTETNPSQEPSTMAKTSNRRSMPRDCWRCWAA